MLMSTVRVVSIVAAVIGALTAVAVIAFGSAP
jgi:hypothetical protein